MRTETPWSTVFELLAETGWETLYMVVLSAVFAVIGGLPLGVLLHVTAPGGRRSPTACSTWSWTSAGRCRS